jgi:hypothetical protein
MVFAYRDYLKKGHAMVPMDTWKTLLKVIFEHRDIGLFSNVFECGFWSVIHDEAVPSSDVESLHQLCAAFGTIGINSINDIQFFEELLKVYQRAKPLFLAQITPMVQPALEKAAYESAQILLACGACRDRLHDFMLPILKEAGALNTSVQVPDYVRSLKIQKPDLFWQLVRISSHAYERQQQLVIAFRVQMNLQKEHDELVQALQNAIEGIDVDAEKAVYNVQTILTGAAGKQPLSVGPLITLVRAVRVALRVSSRNKNHMPTQKSEYDQRILSLDTIDGLLIDYQSRVAPSSSFM